MLPSAHPEADAGFLIMESCTYEGMSGSNTINTATVLLETGIVPMTEPVTRLVLEAPAGLVRVTADCRDWRCERVTFENVPSFATHLGAGGGAGARRAAGRRGLRRRVLRVRRRRGAGLRDRAGGGARLAELGERIRPAVEQQLDIAHPAEPALSALSFVVFTAAPRAGGDA